MTTACEKCNLQGTLSDGTLVRPVPGRGPQPADLMLIGRNPGKRENELGKPFVGPAGHLLDEILEAAGLSFGITMYITNVLKCYTPGDRPPSADELSSCKPQLLDEIDATDPKLIVCLGNEAMETLTGRRGIVNWRGSAWYSSELNRVILVTLHPAYLLHGQIQMKEYVVSDFKKAKRILQSGFKEPVYDYITDNVEARLWFQQEFCSEQT